MIAFVDPVCPAPYSKASLDRGGLGGTEATVVRIAEGLDARVYQHNRTLAEGRYEPLSQLASPSVLVVLRDPKAACEVAEKHPHAALFLWMHDLIEPGKDRGARLRTYAPKLAARKAVIVAVSNFHAQQIETALSSVPGDDRPRVMALYNPLAEGLEHLRQQSFDENAMIYFSSPTKGLDFALFLFEGIRRRWPEMRLLVANPSYVKTSIDAKDGVVQLGPLPQAEVLRHVASSLCAFCPNFEYPETFGLVLAESNAVGTPVIAHPIGAASEVLDDARQVLPVPSIASLAFRASRRLGKGTKLAARLTGTLDGYRPVIERLSDWRSGQRPRVFAREAFSLENVLQQWRSLLGA